MAQVTQLRAWGVMGPVLTFVAKDPIPTPHESVDTFFAGLVATAGTKYRIKVRQREGTPTMDTSAVVCTLRASLYARSTS